VRPPQTWVAQPRIHASGTGACDLTRRAERAIATIEKNFIVIDRLQGWEVQDCGVVGGLLDLN
jgi:hypothetical protein